MNPTGRRNALNQVNMTSRSPFKGRGGDTTQQHDSERVKRAVYENITKNFDIFEFLDNDQ
jgi:hypothetical protein